MNRTKLIEKVDFLKSTMKNQIEECAKLAGLENEPNTFTYLDMMAEDTGLELDNLDLLSDEELVYILDCYIVVDPKEANND